MTTAQQLIDETKRHLLSQQREPMNKTSGPITNVQTTLTLVYETNFPSAGNYLQVDLEMMYVWAVDTATNVVTVERGQQGSIAAAHAISATVVVNPKFPDFAILKALNDELKDLSTPLNGLYAVRSLDLTGSANTGGYDLAGATNFLELLDVRAKQPGIQRTWQPITSYDLSRQVNQTDFPSGLSLSLSEGVWPGRTIRVLYKAEFAPLVNLADDVETVTGLPARMHDIPPMGAVMRLVAPREIRRNFTETQGDTRRASEVQAGAVGGSMRGVAALRQSRITAEAARLAQLYPDKISLGNFGYDGWW